MSFCQRGQANTSFMKSNCFPYNSIKLASWRVIPASGDALCIHPCLKCMQEVNTANTVSVLLAGITFYFCDKYSLNDNELGWFYLHMQMSDISHTSNNLMLVDMPLLGKQLAISYVLRT